jgi:hypothetical protein
LEVTVRIELTKYGFANRPVSHSGTSPHQRVATSYQSRVGLVNED